ncbi:hypothetical protein RND81_05G152000 [Saponaria officinalis]|uniref:Uncharacterized protein n=1 Tax=Saponaria officinalis TaxID=3572 RepID=A0AAW1L189_SAPOF
MSVFRLLANFCDELHSLVSRFWWGSEQGKRKISWVAWKKLCQPKCYGGLGFRDFHKFNLALLRKQVWRLMTNKECLMARILLAKYSPSGNVMTAELGSNPSYTWRGIHEARGVLRGGLRRRLGNGLSTRVWGDPWILNTQTGKVLSPRNGADDSMLVADLWNSGGSRWDCQKVRSLFLPFEQECILNIRISNTRPEDAWYWAYEKDGSYSVKSAYKLISTEDSEWVG